jgi:hydrogenase maturation protease
MVSGGEMIRVLGFGSEALMDDGIPIRIISDLEQSVHSESIDYTTSVVGGLELLELLNDFHTAILIDTIKTPGGKPGDVYQFDPSNCRETYHLSCSHDVSFREALELGKTLGYNLPKRIIIFAIEIEKNLDLSMELSEALEERYQEIYSKIRDCVLREILSDKVRL